MNSENENILKYIQELFGNKAEAINILNDNIDIDTQLEYFEYPRDFVSSLTDEEIVKRRNEIFGTEISSDQKKDLLVQLASVNNIKAYRTIEDYLYDQNTDLDDWAKLALHESEMLIKSSLLNEATILLATGLGAKDNKLRYFIVFLTKEGEQLSEFRKKVIHAELQYTLGKNNSLLESTDANDKFYSATCLVPMQESLQELFYKIIVECNNYGDFLQYDFIINNTKVLSFEEIDELLREKLAKRNG